ncbi:uncharacterized protein LOC118184237 isoform X1 [Stegodyphus dumicola]|uniref:uncharacterized protein LOC118184237 isoform X1 n=1 Tax=Stegodyphus dumicola TaxID=202533 RepID=UPI0015AAC4BB|nr:uncharacterized protein LOC118184237 isoform X1 [Stegodyphus dumicola]
MAKEVEEKEEEEEEAGRQEEPADGPLVEVVKEEVAEKVAAAVVVVGHQVLKIGLLVAVVTGPVAGAIGRVVVEVEAGKKLKTGGEMLVPWKTYNTKFLRSYVDHFPLT